MREQDFLEIIMMLELKKKQIRDNSPKPLSKEDQAIIEYTDKLIFELLEKQHSGLKTPQPPVFRGMAPNPTSK